ncbi:MAG: outer membrane beta-barrel protein [Desulfobacteraceae bacterium]|nr:outer membrane beta-barrel protein [Desulfobacteraceae bacterium]
MKTCLVTVVTIIIFAIPSFSAAAGGRPGPYFTAFLGTSFARDTTVTFYDYVNPATDDRVTFDPGIYVGGSGGYDFGFMRLEGELSYRNAQLDTVTFANGEHFRNVDGDLGALAGMFNVFFDMRNPSRITPYLGGGIGFATLHLSDTTGYGNTVGYQLLYDKSDDTVFAYQVGAGMDVALNSRMSLDIGYRYFITDKAKLESDFNTTNELRFESHNAMIGFKFKF